MPTSLNHELRWIHQYNLPKISIRQVRVWHGGGSNDVDVGIGHVSWVSCLMEYTWIIGGFSNVGTIATEPRSLDCEVKELGDEEEINIG